MAEEKKLTKEKESYLYGALSYFWVLSVVFLILKKEDSFVVFHAKQGLVLFIASFLTWVPFFGQIFGVVVFIAMVVGFIKALQGERFKLPLIADLAEKIKI